MSDRPSTISPSAGLAARWDGPPGRCKREYGTPRPATAMLRSQAVERVIAAMHERLDEPLSLDALAEVAVLSRYHFSRVFHRVTGLPPTQFLAILRLAEAKRLLLTSSLNVADICFRVGYSSIGSFTVRFSRSVGISPGRFRQLQQPLGLTGFGGDQIHESELRRTDSVSVTSRVSGHVYAPVALPGPVFVGLFKTSVPEGEPIRCAVLQGPGAYRLLQVPEGTYYVLAASFPWPDDKPAPLLPDSESLQIGSAGAVHVTGSKAIRDVDLWLRAATPTDPPVLVALPALLARRQAADHAGIR